MEEDKVKKENQQNKRMQKKWKGGSETEGRGAEEIVGGGWGKRWRMEEADGEQKREAILVEGGCNEWLEEGRAEGRDGGAGELKRWNANNGVGAGNEPGWQDSEVEELKTRHK